MISLIKIALSWIGPLEREWSTSLNLGLRLAKEFHCVLEVGSQLLRQSRERCGVMCHVKFCSDVGGSLLTVFWTLCVRLEVSLQPSK